MVRVGGVEDALLDELIERFGKGAVLTVSPYVRDSGETLRWVLQIDGKEPTDLDIRIEEPPERPGQISMSLIRGDDELEVGRWAKSRFPEGALVNWTLGGLRRFDADRFWGP